MEKEKSVGGTFISAKVRTTQGGERKEGKPCAQDRRHGRKRRALGTIKASEGGWGGGEKKTPSTATELP